LVRVSGLRYCDRLTPVQLPNDIEIKLLGCGQSVIVAVTTDNRIFASFGSHDDLILEDHKKNYLPIFALEMPKFAREKNISALACGVCHALFVFNGCELWSASPFYWSGTGCKNLYPLLDKISECELASNTKIITHVKCGINFSVVVLEEQYIYTCGQDNFGQCCRSDQAEEKVFYRINDPENIQQQGILQLECGPSHLVILTKEKRIYMCGSKNSG
jgi:alpha-tubulin suppressor-like RCC1 family protein